VTEEKNNKEDTLWEKYLGKELARRYRVFSPAWFDFTWYFDAIIDNENAKNVLNIILCNYNVNPNDERYWTSQIGQKKVAVRAGCSLSTVRNQLERVAKLEFPCPFCKEKQTGIIGIEGRGNGRTKSYSIKPLLTWLLHLQRHFHELTEDEFAYYQEKFLSERNPEVTEAQREARSENILDWHKEQGHCVTQPDQEQPEFTTEGDF
jgi:hypothetical protein